MKTLYPVIYLLCLLVVACNHPKDTPKTSDTLLHFNEETTDTTLSQHIQAIHFLPLEASENAQLFGVDKMMIRNGLIYLGDYRSGKITAYDLQGKVKFVLDKKGQGPQEYLEMVGFTVDQQSLYTIDNYRHTLNVYDCYTGEYRQTLKLPFVTWDVELLPDNHFIFAYIPSQGGKPNMDQPPYRIFITDKELNIKNKLLRYADDDFEFIGQRTYLSFSDNKVAFHSAESDTVYFFSGKDSVSRIAIDFENKIPSQHRHDLELVKEKGYWYLFNTPICNKHYMTMRVSQDEYLIDYIYNPATQQFLSNGFSNTHNFLLSPQAVHQEQFVSYLDDYFLYQDLVEYGFTRASKAIEQHLEKEGAVLLFYTLH